MPRFTKKDVKFIADQLTNNEFSTDAEMILDLAQKVGKPVGKMAKLVKTERTNFMNNIIFDDEAEKIIRKYLRHPRNF